MGSKTQKSSPSRNSTSSRATYRRWGTLRFCPTPSAASASMFPPSISVANAKKNYVYIYDARSTFNAFAGCAQFSNENVETFGQFFSFLFRQTKRSPIAANPDDNLPTAQMAFFISALFISVYACRTVHLIYWAGIRKSPQKTSPEPIKFSAYLKL